MKLLVLAAIKTQVEVVNAEFSWMPEPIELWFPQMYMDGEWSCNLVFSKIVGSKVIMQFIPMLEALGCSWFVYVTNGDIAIEIQ